MRESRVRRHARVRKRVIGTAERPRLAVHRSAKNITAQIIDDVAGVTIVSAASFDKRMRPTLKSGGNLDAAKAVGAQVARLAKEKSITRVVFDRGGYAYHGRIRSLAEAARENGLQF
jgi:large subunit ribosomal protein L18